MSNPVRLRSSFEVRVWVDSVEKVSKIEAVELEFETIESEQMIF